MRRYLLCALSIACITLAASAQTTTSDLISEKKSGEPWALEPTAYRELPFGATEGDVAAKFGKLKCSVYAAPFSHRSCRIAEKDHWLRIGDISMYETFDFLDGHLAQIEIRNDPGSMWSGTPPPAAPFSAVRDAFVARYGVPTLDQTYRVKGTRNITNRYGGLLAVEPFEYKRSLLTWEGNAVRVVLGGQIDGDDLYVASITAAAWSNAESAAKKKTAKTDF